MGCMPLMAKNSQISEEETTEGLQEILRIMGLSTTFPLNIEVLVDFQLAEHLKIHKVKYFSGVDPNILG